VPRRETIAPPLVDQGPRGGRDAPIGVRGEGSRANSRLSWCGKMALGGLPASPPVSVVPESSFIQGKPTVTRRSRKAVRGT